MSTVRGVEPLQVSVQGHPRDQASWSALAQQVEGHGLSGLYVADHPGTSAAPFVALAAAAAVTSQIRLGTYVANAGTWEPLPLAREVATLDAMSGGRALLGIGAGHTPDEWTATGRSFPPAGARVDRMIELADATAALLAGARVSHSGTYFTLVDAALADPRPVQDRVPVLIGGNGDRVLRYGAEHADIIGVNGLAATLSDGHRHEVDWSPSGIARMVTRITGPAQRAGRSPALDLLVQHVDITDDAEQAATDLAGVVPGASRDDLLSCPFVWIGTPDEIAGQLDMHRREYGFSSFTVRDDALGQVLQVMEAAGRA
jgi:probable F420-dependent oxidoreductase